jgi:hypothetical protein
MAAKLISIQEISTTSSAPSIVAGHTSSLANSYPQYFEDVIEQPATTLTGNGNSEMEKAFKRAGLR